MRIGNVIPYQVGCLVTYLNITTSIYCCIVKFSLVRFNDLQAFIYSNWIWCSPIIRLLQSEVRSQSPRLELFIAIAADYHSYYLLLSYYLLVIFLAN